MWFFRRREPEKNICKIREAKKVLQEKICDFRELINATLANALNCKGSLIVSCTSTDTYRQNN